ncbi:hypothetical protein ACERK3_12365 [Phycisphaerales bacterium AB-hyl4]|uniref:Uncharacterized protein n=1 Tax=Natronomicrosphaera hydrolytica TaxID=3242702 RepID=A0ABV4U6Y9_9BACT
MLKLATILDNPGEPPVHTRYRDPRELKSLGYTGVVIYESTALSGVESAEVVTSGEMRRWTINQMDHIARAIDDAHAAGLKVYLFYDVLVLPADVVNRNLIALTCKNRPTTLCPASEQAIELSTAALQSTLARWPRVEGVVLRFGDTDARRLPHLVGNEIYSPHCPRCSQLGRADRVVNIVNRFHDLVVKQMGKQLIARAWNVRPNGLHDSVELARRVIDRLPEPDGDRFLLSFKFTQTDFWRYQKWNPASLACGDRPIIYELQCQREFEGKGGIPNFQASLWRDGYPETREDDEPAGLKNVGDKVNLAGVWAWVRGGGWGGPFVKNETWIDANVFAAPRLADDPSLDAADLARAWVEQRLGITDAAITQSLVDILEHSPEIVRQAFYIGPFARTKTDAWHPSADWIQDDVLDAQAAWRIVQRLSDAQLDELVSEKSRVVEQLGDDRAALQRLVSDRNHATLEPLVNTLTYAESFCETLRDLLAGLVAYRRYQKNHSPAAATIARQKLLAAQSHWNHHTQRHGSMPGVATAFREEHFWEVTQDALAALSESTTT